MSTTKQKDKQHASSRPTRDASFERWEKEGVLHKGLVGDLQALLDDETGADLHFMIDHECVLAHRLVVVARCERYRRKKKLHQPPSADSPVTVQLGKHFSAAAVRDVVRYLYIGKVTMHNNAPFSLLQVCAEFGLPLLQSYLTRHVISHLTNTTVCQTLVGASSLMKNSRDESLKLALKQIAQESRAFLIANGRAIFEGKGFLDLPKETFVGVISSNELSMHEEEVWHAVVRWGQHRSGVKQEVGLWTEEQRSQLQGALQGVLEHIRVGEISSEVFAREVEPTGLLPVEMTLAHYRNNSTHGSGCGSEGNITSPRGGVQEPFPNSALLGGQVEWQLQLLKWIDETSAQQPPPGEWAGPPGDWRLLFRGSRDGFGGQNFHSFCDDRGSTLLVVKTASGWVFGGYSDVSWSSRFKRGKYASSHTCFLYSLLGPALDTPPSKFLVIQPAYAINNHPGNGPIFGSGADLYISSDCNTNQDSYSQLGRSYGDPSCLPHHLAGEQYFMVEEYEVFGLAN